MEPVERRAEPRIRTLLSGQVGLAALRASFEATVPMGRVGREGELDGVLTFLASDASSYVTGQLFVVDGGVTLA